MSLEYKLKKGKSEVMLFGTGERLNLFQGCQVKLSVNGFPSTPLHIISTSACIWTRHLILKLIFKKFTRRQQEE